MKRTATPRLAGLLLALALVAAACSGGAEAESQGEPIPITTFETFAGETISLAAYKGQPLVVNFWASWCPSCVAEMSAAFVPAQESLGEQVAFLGVNIQDERTKALELVEETGVLFDLAEDPSGALYTALAGLGMPFTIFISEDGQILDVHNGALTEGQLVDRISEVLLS
ncbi:MAG: TlpA family protein disulfide reductase [bacterium]|nr:TlpA family protein disulfide reductase [bacterium]MCP4964413.1 TlpA family protein disulfide reductase [bacterium]